MEFARLASDNKRASNKQQASSTGPFLVRRAEGVPKSKKCYHAIRDNFPQPSREQLFFRSDPQVVAKGDLLGVWPVLDPGHLKKFQARVKNGKTRFPGARGPKIENKSYNAIRMVVRNFFTARALTDRIPRGGKSQNTGILGPFGLGQPLGT